MRLVFWSVVLLILSSCHPPRSEAVYEDARLNYSSYHIRVNYQYIPENITLVFFDDLFPDRAGTLLSQLTVSIDGKTEVFTRVIAIDAGECMQKGQNLSALIRHELWHATQSVSLHLTLREFNHICSHLTHHQGYQRNPLEQEAFRHEKEAPVIAYVVGYRQPSHTVLYYYSQSDSVEIKLTPLPHSSLISNVTRIFDVVITVLPLTVAGYLLFFPPQRDQLKPGDNPGLPIKE